MMEKINVGIIGSFQNGKSTFVNCLLNEYVARVGYGCSTTNIATYYKFSDFNYVSICNQDSTTCDIPLLDFIGNKITLSSTDKVDVFLWKPILTHLNIIDTPGINANETDTFTTVETLHQIDSAIFITANKSLSEYELEVIKYLCKISVPFIVVMNCHANYGNWDPNTSENVEKKKTISDQLSACGVFHAEEKIFSVNLCWYAYGIGLLDYYPTEAVEDLELQLSSYARKHKLELNDKQAWINNSLFLPIRKYLMNTQAFNSYTMMSRLSRNIVFAMNEWETGIKNALNELQNG